MIISCLHIICYILGIVILSAIAIIAVVVAYIIVKLTFMKSKKDCSNEINDKRKE